MNTSLGALGHSDVILVEVHKEDKSNLLLPRSLGRVRSVFLMFGSSAVNSASFQSQPMILTLAGLLPSKHILHIFIQQDPAKIKNMVYSVLKFCEDKQFTSVAFPALGTGLCKYTNCVPLVLLLLSCGDIMELQKGLLCSFPEASTHTQEASVPG